MKGKSLESLLELSDSQKRKLLKYSRILQNNKVCLRQNEVYNSPEVFVDRFLPSFEPHKYQRDIFRRVAKNSRNALHGPRGLGKTASLANIILWFATTREARGIGWKVITLATSWAQLINYLWPEVHKWSGRVKLPGDVPLFNNNELLLRSISGSHGRAFAVGAKDRNRIEGGHAEEVLIILDEAKGITREIWDALEGVDAQGKNVLFLATSTPGMPVGRFYDICVQKPGYRDWAVKHVTLEEALESGMISEEWVERRRLQWGEDSPMFKQHVLGLFAGVDDNALFRDTWLNDSMAKTAEDIPPIQTGADIAERGADETIFAAYTGEAITRLEEVVSDDLMEITGMLLRLNEGVGNPPMAVDGLGLGAGVISRMEELNFHPLRFVSSGSAHDSDTFYNARAEAYWLVRELLRKGLLILPDDDLLKEEFLAQMLKPRSDGLIQLVDKREIAKLLGRSPDRADAVVMAIYQVEPWISIQEAMS